MKGLVWRVIGILGLALLSVSLVRCTGSTDPDPPVPPYTITDSTRIIPQEESGAILDYSPEGIITLDLASEIADSIQVGDIIIGQDDEVAYTGFLRKVTAIERQRDGLILETDFALLMEAFTSLHISECVQLRFSDIRGSQCREGVTLQRGRDDETFLLGLSYVLFDLDGDEGTTGDQITIDGSYSFTAEICTEIESHFLDLEKFEISLRTETMADIDLSAAIQWEVPDELTYTLGTWYLGCITFDGIIYLVPTLTLAVHIDGDLTVTFTTSLDYREELENTVGWSESRGFYQEEDSGPIFGSYTPPTLMAECNFETGPSLSLACLLYGVAGPYIQGRLAFDFEAEMGSDECEPELAFALDAYLYAVVGLECDILGLDYPLDDFEIYRWPIPGSPWTFDLSSTGTIHVDPNPDHLNAPWMLTGPCVFEESGNGDSTFTDLLPGDYTIDWGTVPEWTRPPSETQMLQAEGSSTFSGTYSQGPIDPEFVLIEAGTFLMGAPSDEPGSHPDERPQHIVTLSHAFYLLETEVTNQQYADLAQWALDQIPPLVSATTSILRDTLDGSTQELLDIDDSECEISYSGGVFTVDAGKEDHPVNEVTWYGAVAYCDWLSLQEGLPRAYNHGTWQCNGNSPYTAVGYRLPTEAEWEYACRSGSLTAFANGPITDTDCNDPVLNEIGWYCGNSGYSLHSVGQLIPNSLGIYDMHGNLWEWCNDRYSSSYYSSSPGTDPVGPLSGPYRVYRGGYYRSHAPGCRSALRHWDVPYHDESSYGDFGFRPARSAF